MIPSDRRLYEFGPFRLDAAKGVLLRDQQVVTLTPRLVEMLLAFVENSDRVIEKDELMSRLWPDSIVEEANLTVQHFGSCGRRRVSAATKTATL